MSHERQSERAHGPYPHGNRWRIVVIGADGRRIGPRQDGTGGPFSFTTEGEAIAFKEKFNAGTNTRTVSEAVNAYLETQSAKSFETVQYRLTGILGLPGGDRLLRNLTSAVARDMYAKRSGKVAAATHQGELKYARRWAKWCVGKGWLKSNPFDGIEPVGEVGRGKPQLRIDPAMVFVQHLIADESAESTMVLMGLLMGLRAHEVVGRMACELDYGGRILVIGKSKTKAGERMLAVPELLRGRLLKLADGLKPEELLFRGKTRYAMHYHTVKLAKAAGVPRVTPHGLRGTFATMALIGGMPGLHNSMGGLKPADAAKLMGHADDGQTMLRHYAAPGAMETAAIKTVEQLTKPQNWETEPENHFPGPSEGPVN